MILARAGVLPDAATFGSLMQSYINADHLAEAFGVMKDMVGAGVAPSEEEHTVCQSLSALHQIVASCVLLLDFCSFFLLLHAFMYSMRVSSHLMPFSPQM